MKEKVTRMDPRKGMTKGTPPAAGRIETTEGGEKGGAYNLQDEEYRSRGKVSFGMAAWTLEH